MGKFIGADIGEVPSKGVRKRGNKWVAEIRNRHLRGGRHPGRKWLGTFSTAAEAREAYARAVKKIKSSHRPPGSVNSLDVSHTSHSLFSSLSSLPVYTGGKRGRERVPWTDEPKRSKKTRRGICLDNGARCGTLRKEKLIPIASPVNSMLLEEIKDCASFDQEVGKGTVTMHSSTVSSSSDSPRGTFQANQSATKFRPLRSKDFHGTRSRELTLDLCFTSFADSYNSSFNGQASAAASPTSSSATSRWIDEELKNQSFDDSSLEAARGKKKGGIGATHAGRPFESAPATSQVLSKVGHRAAGTFPRSNDAPGVSTIFSYSNTVVDDNIFSPAVLRERYCAWAEQTHAYPMCTCSLLCNGNEKCSSAFSSLCNHTSQLVQNNPKENVEDDFVQDRVPNQGHSSLQEREDQQLHFCGMKVKIEGLAAFKTRHILSELKAEFIPESRCSELPRTGELSEFSRSIRMSTGKEFRSTRNTPVFRIPSPAPSAVCNGIPDHQVLLIETLSPLQHSFESELVEPGSLIFDTAFLSNYEGAFTSEPLKGSDGFNFLPVDDLLEYF